MEMFVPSTIGVVSAPCDLMVITFTWGISNNVQSRRAMTTRGGKCRVTIPIQVKYLQTGSLIGGWISTRCYKINMMLLR